MTEPEEKVEFFPALSFIKSQVAHVDTSIYRIIKIVKKDNHSDTSYIKREEFREAAKDFLVLPDISIEKLKNDYKETRLYDESLEKVILNYMPKQADQEITRQEILIKPDPSGDKVQSIFVNRKITTDDSTIQKILFWEVDKKFRIVTNVQMQDSERTETVDVIWNDFSSD